MKFSAYELSLVDACVSIFVYAGESILLMLDFKTSSSISYCRLTSLFLVRKIYGFDKKKLWQLSLTSCLYLLWMLGCCFDILSGNMIRSLTITDLYLGDLIWFY